MIGFLNGVSAAWWQWMSAMTWQVVLLVLLIWLIDRLLRNHIYPQVRYAIWFIVFIKLIIPPSFGMATGVFQLVQPAAENLYSIVIPGEAGATDPATDNPQAVPAESTKPSLGEAPDESISSVASSSTLNWQVWPFLLWFGGIVVLATRLGMDIARLRRWHDRQRQHEIPAWFNDLLLENAKRLGIERLPAVVFSEQVQAPAVYGFFRPVLLLPSLFEKSLSHEEMHYMILHELAHIKRGDLWVHGFTMLLQIIYWFNPVILWANRRLRNVREICCDATVAARLEEDKPEYRRTLVGAARRLLTERVPATMGLLGVFEEPYHIVNRIKWLERDMSLDKFFISLLSIFVITFFLTFIIPMAPAGSAPVAMQSPVSESAMQQLNGDEQEKYLYGRHETARTRYALGFPVSSQVISAEESWLSPTKAILVEEGRRLIVDLEKSTYTFVNLVTESVVETTIPLEVEGLYDAETGTFFLNRKIFAEVTATGRTREILGYPCHEYKYLRWQARGGERVNQGEMRVWVMDESPVDTKALDIALENRRRLYGGSEAALIEMRNMAGFQAEIDMNPNVGLFGERTISKLKEFGLRTPPKELLEVPEDFRRMRNFSREDF